MSLNTTPNAVRTHIGIFGKRNSGKSSLINAISNQEIAIVSDVKGTTTDPVFRPIEILPIGPCVLIDTAGIDDIGDLGKLRIEKSLDILDKTDVAILVVDANTGISDEDFELINKFKQKKTPYLTVLNKIDAINISKEILNQLKKSTGANVIFSSAKNNIGIEEIKQEIIRLKPDDSQDQILISDLIEENDLVVLVTPIDKSAPKGRLILPQQQVLRDCLDHLAIPVVTTEITLKETLASLSRKPKLVITDSQAFKKVSEDTPSDIPLTSFSIIFARQKGNLNSLYQGAKAIDSLKDGDKVLIAEGCTHHLQSDDIGRYKIPKLLLERTKKDISFDFNSGVTFSKDIEQYSLIIHCGACMMNRKAMLSRIEQAESFGVPIVNYGVFLAYANGILDRAITPFKGELENE
ncbi:MAG: [FeFe] hydrogenase H-cluster maturation GTPase HydF [Clostridioides sp.]|jgi:[FeFe] hydrogenase H-cluster maturation GTPase HydF|nr:[FeFe] hydrogenase H-cluster maturation GTPase HydF [Clostridioides sp.]